MFKKTIYLLISAVVLFGTFTFTDIPVHAQDYQCTITIDANKHDGFNQALPTSGCEDSVVVGFYNSSGFVLMGDNTKNVVNGEIVYLSMGNSVLVKTIPLKEAKPEPKPETKPEPKPETKPAPKPETKPAPKPETKPEPKPETKPAPKPETKPKPSPVTEKEKPTKPKTETNQSKQETTKPKQNTSKPVSSSHSTDTNSNKSNDNKVTDTKKEIVQDPISNDKQSEQVDNTETEQQLTTDTDQENEIEIDVEKEKDIQVMDSKAEHLSLNEFDLTSQEKNSSVLPITLSSLLIIAVGGSSYYVYRKKTKN